MKCIVSRDGEPCIGERHTTNSYFSISVAFLPIELLWWVEFEFNRLKKVLDSPYILKLFKVQLPSNNYNMHKMSYVGVKFLFLLYFVTKKKLMHLQTA